MNQRPWAEMTEPTAEEWLDWLLSNDRDDQLEIARQAIEASRKAHLCFMACHEDLLLTLSNMQRFLTEVVNEPRAAKAEARASRYRSAWRSARRYRQHVRPLISRLESELDDEIARTSVTTS